MVFFDVSEAGKPVLLPTGAETPEVVASTPRIDARRADLVIFGRILGATGGAFWPYSGLGVRAWGVLRALSDPPEAQKSISRHRKSFLGRFGKIEFSTILTRFGPPIPPDLPCLGAEKGQIS